MWMELSKIELVNMDQNFVFEMWRNIENQYEENLIQN
jgi:hypothetical protein